MDIKTAEQSFQNVVYEDDSYNRLLFHFQDFPNEQPYHLCLLIGEAKRHMKKALQQIAENSGKEIYSVDANDLIIQKESECKENIDELFDEFDPEKYLLHLKNGSRFSGVYIGHTLSRVKYATPQERYFLKKMQQKGGFYVIEIDASDDAVSTLKRAAQSIINFPAPKSGLKKMLWNLKQVSLHGSHLKNDRPKKYFNPEVEL